MSQKSTFLEALFLTILIFGIGILVGIWFESYRAAQIDTLYSTSELRLLDWNIEQASLASISCAEANEEIMNFADRIYEEAKLLDKYEGASRLSDTIILKHQKYDLMRVSLLQTAISIKQRCNSSFHIVAYFYQYQEPSTETRAKQTVFSRALGDLKAEKNNEMLLVPIAGDIDMISIKAVIKKFNINELPTILIDEKTRITTAEQIDKIRNYI
jgi:hypothetical protein